MMLYFILLWLVFLVVIMEDSHREYLEFIECNDHWWDEYQAKLEASK